MLEDYVSCFYKEYNNINSIRSNYTMWLPELVFDGKLSRVVDFLKQIRTEYVPLHTLSLACDAGVWKGREREF